MKLYFKINDEWVQPDYDTTNASPLTLNFVFDSLENPSDYISDYSYDFNLPKSARNNRLFDLYNELDSTIKYKPNDSIDYILISDGDTVSEGKCYLKEITQDDYVFSLNGSLQLVLSKLLRCGWNKYDTGDDYTLLQDYWSRLLMTPAVVKYCWEQDSTQFVWDWEQVKQIRGARQRFLQICGYAPTQPNDNSFKTNKWVTDNTSEATTIGNGDYELTAMDMCEWKTTDQSLMPYIYVARLWSIFKDVCKDVTGYDLTLDDRWFNQSFEYLKDMVYILPNKETEIKSDTNQDAFNDSQFVPQDDQHSWLLEEKHFITENKVTTGVGEYAEFQWSIPLEVYGSSRGFPIGGASDTYTPVWSPYVFPLLTITIKNDSTTYSTKTYAYLPMSNATMDNGVDYQFSQSQQTISFLRQLYDNVVEYRYDNNSVFDGDTNIMTHKFGYLNGTTRLQSVANAYVDVKLQYGIIGSYTILNPVNYLRHYYVSGNERVDIINNMFINNECTIRQDVLVNTTRMSESNNELPIDMYHLFGDTAPFAILLKWSKMLGMVFLIDDESHTLKVMRRSDYISDCFTSDMSAKTPQIYPYTGYYNISRIADFTDYTIRPLAWEARNILMNFDDVDDDYAKKYKDKYGTTYGTMRIVTQSHLNSNTAELLCNTEYNTIAPCIITQEAVRNAGGVMQNTDFKKMDADAFLRPISNTFCFRLNNSTWSGTARYNNYRSDEGGNYVYITGLTDYELQNDERYWHKNLIGLDQKTYSRPVFSDVNSKGYSVLFGEPMEYYYDEDEAVNIKYLFNAEWRNYINEIYNIDNKTLELSVAVDGQLYNRLKIVPFVTLGNIGYLVTEISDWNEYNKMTRITLRQITNIDDMTKDKKPKGVVNASI